MTTIYHPLSVLYLPHAHPPLNPISYSLSSSLLCQDSPLVPAVVKAGRLDQRKQVSSVISAGSEVKSGFRISVRARCSWQFVSGHTEGENWEIGFRHLHRAPREIIRTTAWYTPHHIFDY
ncbi:hypothetical protein PBY51_003154 [Eleginops maclovinus]|uniref:Uncharacterized protein n=1 Tax=Eleginops maclovinus TaxID=56733 RepID=A0AAN8ADU2_ELEMC|nr:hypothetical protein PBY51_003154 [Eleginops maclovinus]